MADFRYPSNFILKGLYQNLCSNLERNITKKLKDNNNAVDSEVCKDLLHCLVGVIKCASIQEIILGGTREIFVLSSSSSIRYHPMIIKYCLSIAAKSSSAYSDLRYNSRTVLLF